MVRVDDMYRPRAPCPEGPRIVTPGLWICVFDFLSVRTVFSMIRQAPSKIIRDAVIFVCRRGRWKEVARCISTLVSWDVAGRSPVAIIAYVPGPGMSEEAKTTAACFHAAWALAPSFIAEEVAKQFRSGNVKRYIEYRPTYFLRTYQRMPCWERESNLVAFFRLVEPFIDGLGRIIASLKHVRRSEFCLYLDAWIRSIDIEKEEENEFIWLGLWRALEHWHDGERAGGLLTVYFKTEIEARGVMTAKYARWMTNNWQDVWERNALVEHFADEEEERKNEESSSSEEYESSSSASDKFEARGDIDANAGSDEESVIQARILEDEDDPEAAFRESVPY